MAVLGRYSTWVRKKGVRSLRRTLHKIMECGLLQLLPVVKSHFFGSQQLQRLGSVSNLIEDNQSGVEGIQNAIFLPYVASLRARLAEHAQ